MLGKQLWASMVRAVAGRAGYYVGIAAKQQLDFEKASFADFCLSV